MTLGIFIGSIFFISAIFCFLSVYLFDKPGFVDDGAFGKYYGRKQPKSHNPFDNNLDHLVVFDKNENPSGYKKAVIGYTIFGIIFIFLSILSFLYL